jgi:hypothetical protein
MAETASSIPSASTFVIRFWCEWSVSGSRWRGRIEHVQSGQRAEFVELQDILEFVWGFGIMAEGQMTPRKVDR